MQKFNEIWVPRLLTVELKRVQPDIPESLRCTIVTALALKLRTELEKDTNSCMGWNELMTVLEFAPDKIHSVLRTRK